MMRPSRRDLMLALGAATLPLTPAGAGETPWLTRVNPDWVLTEDQATEWHRVKDRNSPVLTGNEIGRAHV